MVLAPKYTERPIQKDQSTDLQQRTPKDTIEKRQPLQKMSLGKLDIDM
jgi:hypothetical protein